MEARWFSLLAGVAVLVLAGACQTGSVADPETAEDVFSVSAEEAFAEVAALLEDRGYRIRVSDAASGRLEALSPVEPSGPFGEGVQRRVRVTVAEDVPGETIVRMSVARLEEGAIPVHGRATFERPLGAPWYYEDFFNALAARLD